jgi:two-component system LytT family response regulator
VSTPLTVLVCEDEPLAREHLVSLVEAMPSLALVGTAADGRTALTQLDTLRPALVLMDVQMPELDGFAVLAAATHRPQVIFTTAYDRYAVQAFELGSVDYLLKPFGADRFATAIARVLRRVADPAPAPADDAAPTDDGDAAGAVARARELRLDGALARVFVRERGRIVPVAVREIDRLEAEDDHVGLWVRGKRHLVQLPLADFARRLDPSRFIRIHRSHVVNLDSVVALVPYDAGRLQVELRDGAKLIASRAGSQALRELML